MKNILLWSILCSCMLFAACTTVAPEAGEEGVKVHKPWIVGTGGVDMTPVETGLEYTSSYDEKTDHHYDGRI